MSFRHLTRTQNKEVANLLLAGAKTLVLGSVIAVLFPPTGAPRPMVMAAIGFLIGVVVGIIGVALVPDSDAEPGRDLRSTRKGRR